MKVLYTFYHGMFFGWSLVHKLTVHSNDEATLLLGDGWSWCVGVPSNLPQIQRFIDSGIFQDIVTYDNSIGRKQMTVEDTEQEIQKKLDDHFSQKSLMLNSFDKIYSATDAEDVIGIYFSLKQLNYYSFETTPNMLNIRTHSFVLHNFSNMPGYRDALIKHGALIRKNIHESYLAHPESDVSSYPKEKIEVFDPEKAAKSLSNESISLILSSFDYTDLVEICKDKTMLMLINDRVSFQIHDKSYFIQKYFNHINYFDFGIQTILDYFLPPGTIPILKPHPNASIRDNRLEKYLNGIFSINHLFSTLLFNLLPTFSVENTVLLTSTANTQILKFTKNRNIYCPGTSTLSIFYTKFFVVLSLLNHFGMCYKKCGERLVLRGGEQGRIKDYFNRDLAKDINQMVDIHFQDVPENSSSNFVVITEDQIENIESIIQQNDLVIVTDVLEKISYVNILRLNFVVIEISKTPIKNKDDIIAPMDTEYIYVFSKHKYILDALIGWTLTKENIYSGVTIRAISMLPSNVLYLKVNNEALKANNDVLKTENEALKANNDALKKENKTFKTNNDTLKMENEVFKANNDVLKTENETFKVNNDTLKTENETLKINSNILVTENNALKKDIDGILNSKSWKFTKPFRIISGFIWRNT